MLLILFLASFVRIFAASEMHYFSNPCFCSAAEIEQELKQKTIDMCWHFYQDSYFRFIAGNEEVYFEICLGDLSDIDEDFLSRVRNKFIDHSSKESQQMIFSYLLTKDREEVNIPHLFQKQSASPDELSYIVADRRIIENMSPRLIDREELVPIVQNEKVLFYTGAGLSIASGIPGMNELCDQLGFKSLKEFLCAIESAVNHPKEFASKILFFHDACLFSTPSKAHFALKDLATLKKVRIITENLDHLHESSGIRPYRIDPKHLRDEIGTDFLSEFNYIICVGLSFDDRGFLAWYKEHNPQGKIIAVNLQQPSYLDNNDYLLIGDLQEIVSFLKDEIKF